ncbi:MAG: hypothetical protein HYR94_06730, partial [Chloroflexi bacterium]|nr:hypothetical protein [Chloroflexota bacterium]
FVDDALRWFGDPNPTQGSPWDKGERLAHLIRQERTLLILDGLEPLQQPPGPDEGKLTDPSLQALLRELSFDQPGLCLLTTRLPVADRSGDAFQHMVSHTQLADALHQAGRLTEAEAAFAEAETMQKEDDPEHPLLYSLRGFLYCDLLLSQGRFQAVQQRASQTWEWANQYLGLLGVALDNLSLGRAYLAEAVSTLSPDFSPLLLNSSAPLLIQAHHTLDQAVAGLRQAAGERGCRGAGVQRRWVGGGAGTCD